MSDQPRDTHSDRLNDVPHVVYRMLDHGGAPLYIGCTMNLEQRLAQHRPGPLWDRTAKVSTEHHPSREAGLAAEKAAIRAECPLWNTEWNKGVHAVVDAMYYEEYGKPGDVLARWDHARHNHDDLVRRVRQSRGEVSGTFTIGGAAGS